MLIKKLWDKGNLRSPSSNLIFLFLDDMQWGSISPPDQPGSSTSLSLTAALGYSNSRAQLW